MFLLGGLLVLTMSTGLLGSGRPDGWGLLAVIGLGSAHTAAGAWLIMRSPRITVKLEPDQSLRIVRTWPYRRDQRRIHASQISRLLTRVGQDSDGDAIYWLELQLDTGERVRLISVEHHSSAIVENAVVQLQAWSRRTLPHRRDSGSDISAY